MLSLSLIRSLSFSLFLTHTLSLSPPPPLSCSLSLLLTAGLFICMLVARGVPVSPGMSPGWLWGVFVWWLGERRHARLPPP
jgi:hypothetical protein